MPTQSRTRQKEILSEATKVGDLGKLYWFVEMDLPVKFGGGSAAASWRGGVPVIPVLPCVETSQAEAELLRWQFEDGNRGKGWSFHVSLTAIDILDKLAAGWYLWGHERTSIDNVCEYCGRVYATEHHEPWACCGWSLVVTQASPK